jgi:hypothetical protein
VTERRLREIAVRPPLENLLGALQRAPLDRSLDSVAADVGDRLMEASATNIQTWSLRAVAILLIAATGAIAGVAGTTTAAAAEPSPFAAWSSLAPSTLLESHD